MPAACTIDLMMVLIFSFPALIIYIPVGVSALNVQGYLKQRLASRPFDPGVGLIRASRIMPFDMVYYRRRDIVPVIRDMGVDMAAVVVVMGNHFPTVRRTVICKVGMPFISRMCPPGVGSLRILLLKIVLHSRRNTLSFISPLGHNELGASRQQNDEECF